MEIVSVDMGGRVTLAALTLMNALRVLVKTMLTVTILQAVLSAIAMMDSEGMYPQIIVKVLYEMFPFNNKNVAECFLL